MRRTSACRGTRAEIGERGLGEDEVGGGRGVIDRDCGFLLGFSSFFVSLEEKVFWKEEGEKNEKSTKAVLCP